MAPGPPAYGLAEELAAVEVLRGSGLRRALDSVLAAHGLALGRRRLCVSDDRPWRRIGLHHRPGAGVTGVYALRLRHDPPEAPTWPGRLPSQDPDEVVVCLSTGAMPQQTTGEGSSWGDPGPVAVQTDGCAMIGWLWPEDPWLPGLHSSTALIDPSLGLGLPDPEMLHPMPLSYRPTRRAVLRLDAHGREDPAAWLKVVRPAREQELVRRHLSLWEAGVPVPQPLAASDDGAVLLAHVPGHPASKREHGDPAASVQAEHLLALLDRLPSSVMDLTRRPSWTERVLDYARSAAASLPGSAEEVGAHAQAIDAARRTCEEAALVPGHGDFHAGNIMVGPRLLDPSLGPITGLLDLDSVGPGRLDDDLACYLAHRCAQLRDPQDDDAPLSAPSIAPVLEVFDEVVDPASLRVGVSGVLLSLVSSAARRGGQEAAARRLHKSRQALRAAQDV